MNLLEVALQFLALALWRSAPSAPSAAAAGTLVAYSTQLMTLAKTVLYGLSEACSGWKYTGAWQGGCGWWGGVSFEQRAAGGASLPPHVPASFSASRPPPFLPSSAGHNGWSADYVTIVLIPNGLWIAFPAAVVATLGPAITARLAKRGA